MDVDKDTLNIDDTNVIGERYPMAQIKGTLDEVLGAELPEDSYLKVILTEQVLDAMNRLREKYNNVMELQFDLDTGEVKERRYTSADIDKKTPDILFEELAESVGVKLTESEKEVVAGMVDTLIRGGE